jgi:hypothetical protein
MCAGLVVETAGNAVLYHTLQSGAVQASRTRRVSFLPNGRQPTRSDTGSHDRRVLRLSNDCHWQCQRHQAGSLSGLAGACK